MIAGSLTLRMSRSVILTRCVLRSTNTVSPGLGEAHFAEGGACVRDDGREIDAASSQHVRLNAEEEGGFV
jgi:hypothetical protein